MTFFSGFKTGKTLVDKCIIYKSDCRSSVVFQAIISNYQDLMPPEFENYFCYAAMWAFGGTLVEEHRPYFSQWWKEQWNDFVMLPGDEEVDNWL